MVSISNAHISTAVMFKDASSQQPLLPHNGVLTGLVLSFSFHTDHLHSTSVQRGWNANLFIAITMDASLTSNNNA